MPPDLQAVISFPLIVLLCFSLQGLPYSFNKNVSSIQNHTGEQVV